MPDQYLQGHYLLGIEGLALLRAGAERSHDQIEARCEEIREIVSHLDQRPYSERRDLPEADVDAGYAQWADDYDNPGNDTIALEQPIVRRLLDDLPDGAVLDAACGTGRHAAYLAELGRQVIGIDASEAMLARGRAKLPAVDFRLGQLSGLPLADEGWAEPSAPSPSATSQRLAPPSPSLPASSGLAAV
jgi:SAM-dependent methyltransferase